MTLLEKLQPHRGCLLRLKTELFWYDGRGWDNNPGRICLILDAEAITTHTARDTATAGTAAVACTATLASAVAHLLIEGQPQWVWVAEKDVEVINADR